tara:strand:- start:20 stop:397 length:378 start_codon:yes stop_codon:yes gene_type:complete
MTAVTACNPRRLVRVPVEAVEPVVLAVQAAEPRVALVEQDNLLLCRQAAHKPTVEGVAVTALLPALVAQEAAVRLLRQRAFLELLTRAVEVVGVTTPQALLPTAVLVAQESSLFARSSVAPLRVS